MPQPQSRQQPGLNDMQMLQGQLKQFQEIQRQRQLQGLGDGRQLNYINQLSGMNKQATAGQYIPLINGIPTRDASQKFMSNNMNLVQHGTSPTFQGLPNGSYSQNQNQDFRSIGLVPQQLEEPLYGTPISSSTHNSNQYSNLQRFSHDSANALGKSTDNQTEKLTLQLSGFSNSFLGKNCNVSSPQNSTPDKDFLSKQFYHGKDLFGQVPIQGFSGGIIPENQQTLQFSHQEFNGRHDQAGWGEQFPGKTQQTETSQGLPTLDPLEQKILFNMDDNCRNASFDINKDMGTEGFGSMVEEHVAYSSSFPSIQSGSWSALMQSAVAETSSNDTGLQEEWSGLSFQNTEPSTHNQLTNYLDSGKLQTSWADNSSTSSPSCKPQLPFNDSNMSPGFQGYQQLGTQFPVNQKEGIYSDSYHEPVQPSPRVAAKWPDHQSPLNPLIRGSQPIHASQSLDNAWSGQNFEYSEGIAQHQRTSSGGNNQIPNKELVNRIGSNFPSGNPNLNAHHNDNGVNKAWEGNINEGLYEEKEKAPNNYLWKNDNLSSLFSNAAGGLNQVKPGADSTMVKRGDSHLNYVGSLCNSVSPSTKVDPGSSQCPLEHHQLDYIRHGIYVESKGNEVIVDDYYQPSKSQVLANSYEEAGKSYDEKQNCYSREKSNDSHLSNASQHPSIEAEGRQNRWMHGNDSQSLLKINQMSSGQGCLSDIQRNLKASKTPEAAITKAYENSSVAQLTGSVLAPPSQALPNSSSIFSLQSSLQSGNLAAISSTSPLYIRNQHQRSHLADVTVATQSAETTLPGMTNRIKGFNSATSQGPSSLWMNGPTQMHLSGIEPGKLPSNLLFSVDPKNSNLQTPWATQELHDQNSNTGAVLQEVDPYSIISQGHDYDVGHPTKEGSQQQIPLDTVDRASNTHRIFQQESVASHPSESAIASSSSVPNSHQQSLDGRHCGDKQAPPVSARDLEAFGRSLKPSNVHPSHSLLQQVRSLNNVETDYRKASEKNSGVDSHLNVQQVTATAGLQLLHGYSPGFRDPVNDGVNSVSRLNSFPSGDVKMLSFSPEIGDSQTAKSSSVPLLESILQHTATCGQSYHQDDSTRNNLTFSRTEQSQPNLQMAPSGFQQYGTHGQMLSMYAKKHVQQLPLGRPFENLHTNTCLVQANAVGAGGVSGVGPTAATGLVAAKSSPHVLPPPAIDHSLSVVRPKKRKTATFELLPWHKEVTQSSKRLRTISMAELDWARAVNRLTERVDDETEMIEDVRPFIRSKKRLVLTTQLMHLVFRPTPASIFSADASSNYDSVSYFAAKLVLGEACNLIFSSSTNSCLSSSSCDVISEKPTTSERVGEPHFSKIVEDFTSRARKLENDLFRVEKTASILDIKVEYQELEKFSIINRFAKYHCRGQKPDATGTSSSSCSTATGVKLIPQRYVIAFPMPKAVPEGTQCLSL